VIDHWRGFREFCALDKMSGGPDSHMKTIVHLAREMNPWDKVWLAGLYVAVYNVPMALVLHDAAPRRDELVALERLVHENWSGVVLRRERRRPVGSPVKLMDCVRSVSSWVDSYTHRLIAMDYEQMWEAADEIRYFGRYAKLKFLETLRQMGLTKEIVPDIRAYDGWSPREGLCLLYPDDESCYLLRQGSTPREIVEVEALANKTFAKFSATLNRYELQVFLCDYKQCVNGRQYPGRSLDSELDHHANVIKTFGKTYGSNVGRDLFTAREELFPSWALGEKQGWTGVREELTEFFSRTGDMWSDSIWEFRDGAIRGRR
jgi:hypothetical protein